MSFQILVTVVGIDKHLLFGRDLIVSGKLRGRWAGGIHQTCTHQYLSANAGGEELNIDVTQLFKDLILALVSGVEMTEVVAQALVSSFCKIHFPYALIVGQIGINGGAKLDGRNERGTGNCQCATLRATVCTYTGLIHVVKPHDDACEHRGIQKQIAAEQILGRAVQTSGKGRGVGRTCLTAYVLRKTALSAAIQRCDAEAL